MPSFFYKAKSKTGDLLQDVIDANSKFEACRIIEAKGLIPITIYEGEIPPSPPPSVRISFRLSHRPKWLFFLIAFGIIIFVATIIIYMTGLSSYMRAKYAYRNNNYAQCIDIMDASPTPMRNTKWAKTLLSDALAALLNNLYNTDQYDKCVTIIDNLIKLHPQNASNKELLLMRDASRIALAEQRMNAHDFAGALSNLALVPDESTLHDRVQALTRNVNLKKDIDAQLPVSAIVKSKSVIITNLAKINIQSGIVDYIDLSNKKLYLHNRTRDRVKPDLHVLILNKDGVILLSHSESWAFNTLDYGKYNVSEIMGRLTFPRSLIYSRWAVLGWDITPKYAMVVGSRISYNELLNMLHNESQRLRHTPPERLTTYYSLSDVLPEAMKYELDSRIQIYDSEIVDSVFFKPGKVIIQYYNKTDMRIKPLIIGHVFNADGVIIGTFKNEWLMMDLEPNQSDSVSVNLQFDIPDELVFSRWAPVAYDLQPVYFVLAGSSAQYADMVNRAEMRIRELNQKSP